MSRSFSNAVAGLAAGLGLVALLAIVTFSGSHSVSLVSFPATDLGMLKVMESMTAPEPKVTKTQQMATAGSDAKDTKKGLSMQQQYVRIMQNQGYFAPWSRTNNWNDRLAINNIRKHNTPEALAAKEKKIAAENAKFARKFSTPHTSMYTGVHQSIDQILDPKFQPWGNQGPREAYYEGY